MIYARMRGTREPVGFYFLELLDDEELDAHTIIALFWMIDEELNPFECEFTEVMNVGFNKFAMVYPNKMKRVPYDEDEPEYGTFWDGDFRLNDAAESFISNDEELDKCEWLNFSGKDTGYYYG
jgi:hypothetical protein